MHTADLPHVLVVAGDADEISAIRRTLEPGPFRCTGAIGSREALAIARQTPVDVALLDVSGLRPSEGLLMAQRFRDEGRDPGVVMIAASRSLEDLIDALRIGVVDYLAKPLGANELTDAVSRAVEWRTAARTAREELRGYEREMAATAVRIGGELAAAGIRSSDELEACLERLYQRNRAALDHGRRVAVTARTIAVRVDVAEPLLGHVERAGLLHDIGKLAVPRSILQKAWPLSATEQAIVRSHVSAAAEALARVPFLEPTAEIVGASREQYDGRGYPRGRRGAAIPVGARIVAVAEAFDTLGGSRARLDPTAVDAANAELVRGAGSRFDPAIVRAWLQESTACF